MSSLRILHLEDNPVDADLVEAMLDTEGVSCDITRAATGPAFVAALKGGCFDLILADYSLPSFNGIAALALAHQRCPDVPFIFVSGALGEELAVETLKNGATDYVLKHRMERLTPAVLRALRESGERRKRHQAEAQLMEAKLEAERASAVKSQLLERTGHELSASLTTILTSARSLESDALTEQQQASVRQILSEGQHLIGLVDHLFATASSTTAEEVAVTRTGR
jgi:CheY-like chemotaxis protein